MLVFLVLVVGGQNVLANVVKVLVDRARPDIHPLAGFSGASFPSGHSAAAAATYAACALLHRPSRARRESQAVLAGAAVAIAVAVASSRVLLGVHWFTDVLAGLALAGRGSRSARSRSVAGCCASVHRWRSPSGRPSQR